ncbi:adenylate and Guanylate cyclase catalytic domain protein [Mycobacterium avium subsp. avium 2285 (R)]|nr:adenylate and Guanylate cyclase catalytic domain protein [Mycobacterium avium subsp. avium 2285 (R)]
MGRCGQPGLPNAQRLTATRIYVSSQVYEAMRDVRQFAPAGTISVGGTDQAIYRLLER